MGILINIGTKIRMVVYTRLALAGQVGINVHFAECINITGVPTFEDQVAGMASTMGNLYVPLLTQNAKFRGVTMQDWTSAPPMIDPTVSPLLDVAGTGGAIPLPTDKCGAVTWKTFGSGRRYRGRSYIPFPSTDDMDGDASVKNSYLLKLATLIAGFVPNWISLNVPNASGATWKKVIPHVRTPPLLSTDVTTGKARDYWNEQHRRGSHGALNPVDPWT